MAQHSSITLTLNLFVFKFIIFKFEFKCWDVIKFYTQEHYPKQLRPFSMREVPRYSYNSSLSCLISKFGY